MKLFYVLIFAALLAISTSKISRRTWKRHNTRAPTPTTKSNLYIFFKVIVLRVSLLANLQIDPKVLDTCFPPSDAYRTASDDQMEKNDDFSKANSDLKVQAGAWNSIKKYLEEGINFVCHYKDYVKEFVNYLASSLKSLFKRRRVFISRKRIRRNIIDFISTKVDLFKETTNKLLAEIKNGVKIVTNKVFATIEEVRDYMSKSIENLFSPIINKLIEIKQNIKNFWENSLLKKIKDYITTCYPPMKALAGVFKSAIVTIAELVLLKPDTWFSIILKMICNWKILIDAVNYLLIDTKDIASKWYNAGDFVGTMIYIFSLA